MIVNTKQAIKIIADGLKNECMAFSTFSRYCDSGLITGKLTHEKKSKDPLFFKKSEIIKSIDRVRIHLAKQTQAKKKARTKVPNYYTDYKETENYTNAFNLFNKLV